mmetsp:Transcript_532/g.1431  ORF Transcript_532/g.1431 Transcript_532/m.1431 type:complete len:274 (-) Transcript_532:599-1420(-)
MSWHSRSVLTLVPMLENLRPCASRHSPWPMKTGTPLAPTASLNTCAVKASSPARRSLVRQMSKMQSLFMRASSTRLHLSSACCRRPSGHRFTASSRSSRPRLSVRSASGCSARARSEAGADLPLKRSRLFTTGSKSVPRGMFQEGTTGFASSSGIPLKFPQYPPCSAEPSAGRGIATTTDMKSTPVTVTWMSPGSLKRKSPPRGWPRNRSCQSPMSNFASVRICRIWSSWMATSHSVLLWASRTSGSRNSSSVLFRIGLPSKTARRPPPDVSL